MKQPFLNRELSQLAFIERVMAQVEDERVPLLERLRFIFIVSGNLDEFFEIRVAGLKDKVALGNGQVGNDGFTNEQALKKISERAHILVTRVYQVFNDVLLPQLAKENIVFVPEKKWDSPMRKWVHHLFYSEILPLLSPVGLDMSHPLPRLVNKSLNFIVALEGKDAFGRDSGLAIVHAPRALPRVYKLPPELAKRSDKFIFLTSIIEAHLKELFPGMTIKGCYQCRLTRNSDLYLEEEKTSDLANAMRQQLRTRKYGHSARLEIDARCPEEIADFLLKQHHLTKDDLYYCDGPVNLNRYLPVVDLLNHHHLRYPPQHPAIPSFLKRQPNIFQAVQHEDLLLHHPYQSFAPVLDLLRQATIDPNVLAIKQTLYRTGPVSSLVTALADAARAGKEVTAIIEIRARQDEENNLEVANVLQEAGALVIYGVIGLKTHAKMSLIVRREGKILRRYAHLGTGNYHEGTAKSYVDLGLITCDDALTNDVQKVFQLLTGMGKAYRLSKLLISPFTLYPHLRKMIFQEIAHVKAGKSGRIILKANGLSDPHIIHDLYTASNAGVKIDLIIRGLCCLQPGIPDMSENIRVRSIIGRFLEHERVYYFANNGDEKIYCSSADLMERNLYHRVEVCFPIENPRLIQRVKQEALLAHLADSAQCWELLADGEYERMKPKKTKLIPAQELLVAKFES